MPTRLPRLLAPIAAFALCWAPSTAWACAVCAGGEDDRSRTAFIFMTAFMTLMPFLLLGGLGWVLWRRMREIERRAEARLEPAGAASRVLPGA